MKKLFTILMMAAFVVAGSMATAQEKSAKERVKERKEISKLAKKELKERASKDARKEAKKLAKEGWEVKPGSLPMDKMLDRCYEMFYEYNDDGSPLYIIGHGQAQGGSYTAASKAAQMQAITDLAEQISIYVTELIEQTVANSEISQNEVASISEIVASSKSLVAQRINNSVRVLELQRKLSGGRLEMQVRVAFNKKNAMAIAQDVVREELKKKGEQLHEELDKMMWQ